MTARVTVGFAAVAAVLCLCSAPKCVAAAATPPHIIFIVADDLGWNDVGFHGSLQIPTPNIDALAYSGVILNNYYVQPICTPSRSAIMTGKHPIHTGLQHTTIAGPQPYGLPLNITTLPQHLASLNYVPRAVGKWHLGFFRKEYTPTYRGFDSHFGYWSGRVDYYDHTANEEKDLWGYDFRRNMDVAHDAYGLYATDLFTKEAVATISSHNASRPLFLYLAHLAVHSANPYAPLQAPQDVLDGLSYIQDEKRRTFGGMLTKLDQSVGAVVQALQERAMLDNAIIVFTTDNGGPAGGFNLNAASNWPLRGVKATMWEGGVRGAGFVWSPLISQPPGTVAPQLLTIEDWLPTLYAAAGGDASSLSGLDGLNVWPTLSSGAPTQRTSLLHNIDPVFNGAAVRMGDWKLLYNPSWYDKRFDSWFGPSGRNLTAPETQLPVVLQQIRDSPAGRVVLARNSHALDNMQQARDQAQVNCTETPVVPPFFCRSEGQPVQPCLFHIPSDPCEQSDVSQQHPDIVAALLELLHQYNSTAVPLLNKPSDLAADPKYWNYNWNNWMDYPTPTGVDLAKAKEEDERKRKPYERLFDFFFKNKHGHEGPASGLRPLN